VVHVGCGAQPFRSLLSPEAKYVGLDIEAADERFGYDVPDVIHSTGCC